MKKVYNDFIDYLVLYYYNVLYQTFLERSCLLV